MGFNKVKKFQKTTTSSKNGKSSCNNNNTTNKKIKKVIITTNRYINKKQRPEDETESEEELVEEEPVKKCCKKKKCKKPEPEPIEEEEECEYKPLEIFYKKCKVPEPIEEEPEPEPECKPKKKCKKVVQCKPLGGYSFAYSTEEQKFDVANEYQDVHFDQFPTHTGWLLTEEGYALNVKCKGVYYIQYSLHLDIDDTSGAPDASIRLIKHSNYSNNFQEIQGSQSFAQIDSSSKIHTSFVITPLCACDEIKLQVAPSGTNLYLKKDDVSNLSTTPVTAKISIIRLA
jgi:hypothetical protein